MAGLKWSAGIIAAIKADKSWTSIKAQLSAVPYHIDVIYDGYASYATQSFLSKSTVQARTVVLLSILPFVKKQGKAVKESIPSLTEMTYATLMTLIPFSEECNEQQPEK